MNDDLDFETLMRLTSGKRGTIDCACPKCGPYRKSKVNQIRKVLRIWDDGELVTFNCERCGLHGWAKDDKHVHAKRHEPQPKAASANAGDKSGIARFLWDKARPSPGTIVESYLKSRSCWIASPNIRFLPGRNEHPPAMIARFGACDTPVTGVHLTKLKADGSGKAELEDKVKIMLGSSLGQPIIIHDNPERGEASLCEGIEDAASMAIATGWTAWAAGSARRIPSVVPLTLSFERLFVGVDFDPTDRAAEKSVQRAFQTRRDLIPLRFAKALGIKDRADANMALRRFGPPSIMAVIEWCEAQARHYRGEIGFGQMSREMLNAAGVFSQIAEAA